MKNQSMTSNIHYPSPIFSLYNIFANVDSFRGYRKSFFRHEQNTHIQTIPLSTESQKHYSRPQPNGQDYKIKQKNKNKKPTSNSKEA